MNRRLKFIVALLLALTALAGAGMLLYQSSDTLPAGKVSSMKMIFALSAVKEAVDICWSEKKLAVADCSEAKALMPQQKLPDVNYWITAQGILIGIDYRERVLVVLSAQVANDALVWQCSGAPAGSLPKACSPLENL
jgi:hypothetical protein